MSSGTEGEQANSEPLLLLLLLPLSGKEAEEAPFPPKSAMKKQVEVETESLRCCCFENLAAKIRLGNVGLNKKSDSLGSTHAN